MIKFTCPDFYYGFKVYGLLDEIKREFPECLNEDAQITSIFGSLPNMIWNGGSCYFDNIVQIDEAEYYANFFAEQGIPLKLTFTNTLLEKEDCYDRYCNAIAKIFENENNTIMVASPILEEYLREKYPKYKFSKSIVGSTSDDDYLNYKETLKRYDNIVLPRRLSKDFQFLNSVDHEYRSRIEILCNDPCPVNCPRLYEHYKGMAKIQLYQEPLSKSCILEDGTIEAAIMKPTKYIQNQITIDEIRKDYIPLGYDNFKLSGRMAPIVVLFSTARYLVKPEYVINYLYYMTTALLRG